MVDHFVRAVDTTTQGSSQAFFPRGIEPDDGVESTWRQSLRWCGLRCRLHEKLGIFRLALPLSSL